MKLRPPPGPMVAPSAQARLAAELADLDETTIVVAEADVLVAVQELIPASARSLQNMVFAMALEIIKRQTCGVYMLADWIYTRQVVTLLIATRRVCDPSLQLRPEHLEDLTPAQARRSVAAEARDIADTVVHLNAQLFRVLEDWRAARSILDLPVPRRRKGPMPAAPPKVPRGRRA